MQDPNNTNNPYTGSTQHVTDATASEVKQDDVTMALLSHILALFFGFIVPLIIFIKYKDDTTPSGRFVLNHAKESLNFQITLLIGYIVSMILMFILIGIATFFILMIYGLVCIILATLAAKDRKPYRYPFALRLIK